MLMTMRVVRAIVGLVALILLKASVQPGVQFFVGADESSLEPLGIRLIGGMLAITAFFYLRHSINNAYVSHGKGPGPLRTRLHL